MTMQADMNWFAVLAHHASRTPDKALAIFEGTTTTYAEMAARAAALAGGLRSAGIGRGDVVGLLSYNCPEFLETVFAANYLGAIAMPINWRLAAPEVRYILEHSEAGALVCAVGANEPTARELDNAVLERATFVCVDSRDQARLESGDLIEPVAQGVLDWLEVHELHEVVGGEVPGRQSDDDIVVFKSNGLAAWDVAIGAAALDRARERGVGKEL